MQAILNLASLGELAGGAARGIIDAAIDDAVRDIDDRGDDEKPRVVNILLTLQQHENGVVLADVQAEAKLPKRRTTATLGNVRKNLGVPAVQFQTLSPTNPDQNTLDSIPGAIRGED